MIFFSIIIKMLFLMPNCHFDTFYMFLKAAKLPSWQNHVTKQLVCLFYTILARIMRAFFAYVLCFPTQTG